MTGGDYDFQVRLLRQPVGKDAGSTAKFCFYQFCVNPFQQSYFTQGFLYTNYDQHKVTFMTVSAVNRSFQCPAICRFFERELCSHFYLLNIRFVLDSLKNIEQRNKLYANGLALQLPSGKMFTHLYIQNLSPSSQHLGCFLILHCSSFHIVSESKTQLLPNNYHLPQSHRPHGLTVGGCPLLIAFHKLLVIQVWIVVYRHVWVWAEVASSSPSSQPILYRAPFPESRVVLRQSDGLHTP